jgi:antibiotic biosynthesis monooxygenase (ABM) superfamily enzyme
MMFETTISADNPVVTLINVSTVEPSRQQQLVELWQRATDEVLRHLPGFVSANVHRSFDGTKVVNYAQWQTREAFQAMLANPDARPWLEQLAEVGAPAPVLCEVVSTHHASG